MFTRLATVIATVAAAATFGAAVPATAAAAPLASNPIWVACSSNQYESSNDDCVNDPGANPIGATALCQDGTYSDSEHCSGTCSRHGGVARWLISGC